MHTHHPSNHHPPTHLSLYSTTPSHSLIIVLNVLCDSHTGPEQGGGGGRGKGEGWRVEGHEHGCPCLHLAWHNYVRLSVHAHTLLVRVLLLSCSQSALSTLLSSFPPSLSPITSPSSSSLLSPLPPSPPPLCHMSQCPVSTVTYVSASSSSSPAVEGVQRIRSDKHTSTVYVTQSQLREPLTRSPSTSSFLRFLRLPFCVASSKLPSSSAYSEKDVDGQTRGDADQLTTSHKEGCFLWHFVYPQPRPCPHPQPRPCPHPQPRPCPHP